MWEWSEGSRVMRGKGGVKWRREGVEVRWKQEKREVP